MSFKKYFLISSLTLLLIPNFSAYAGSLEDGIAFYKAGNYEKAIEVLKKSVQEDPENPEPHLWLSKSYESLLEIEKVFPETKLYQDLKRKRDLKNKQEAEKKLLEEQKKLEESNKVVEITDPTKIIIINDDYLIKTMSKRDMSSEVKNLQFFDHKQLKSLIISLPNDNEALIKAYKEYQIKSHYGIANPGEILLMNKAKTDLIAFDIESKKLAISEETDSENKKMQQSDLERLVKEYNSYLDQAEKIINQPIYGNYDSFSYDYFLASETTPDLFIQTLEDKKISFKTIIDTMVIDFNNIKKSIEAQEKDMISKKQGIEPELLNADIRNLFGDKKEKVALYQSFRDKLESDKIKVKNISIEDHILTNAYNTMNATIKKIKPNYIIKNITSIK